MVELCYRNVHHQNLQENMCLVSCISVFASVVKSMVISKFSAPTTAFLAF